MRQRTGSALVQIMCCLNQCWVIVDWTLRNKYQWNFNQNAKFPFTEMHMKTSFAKWQPFWIGGDEVKHININKIWWVKKTCSHVGKKKRSGEGPRPNTPKAPTAAPMIMMGRPHFCNVNNDYDDHQYHSYHRRRRRRGHYHNHKYNHKHHHHRDHHHHQQQQWEQRHLHLVSNLILWHIQYPSLRKRYWTMWYKKTIWKRRLFVRKTCSLTTLSYPIFVD